MADRPDAFISLTSVKKPSAVDPQTALEQIRRIYFKTTKQTIDNDLAHAIELLKSLGSEEQREKAAVFMEGIAQMRSEWARETKRKSGGNQSGGKQSSRKQGGGKPRGRKRT